MRTLIPTVTRLFEIGPEDVADMSNDYYTPPWIFDAAGLVFDLDVAAPVDSSRRTCPAKRYLTPVEDGLIAPWDGLVWMNPPYSGAAPWVERFAAHDCGLAMLPAVKGVYWLGRLLQAADALAILGRVEFGRPDSKWAQLPVPVILAARGEACTAALARVAAVDKYVRGAYHVRAR